MFFLLVYSHYGPMCWAFIANSSKRTWIYVYMYVRIYWMLGAHQPYTCSCWISRRCFIDLQNDDVYAFNINRNTYIQLPLFAVCTQFSQSEYVKKWGKRIEKKSNIGTGNGTRNATETGTNAYRNTHTRSRDIRYIFRMSYTILV